MDIISYSQFEIDSKIRINWNIFNNVFKYEYDKNPRLTRYLSKLSDQYNRYKETYKFPTKYKGMNNF